MNLWKAFWHCRKNHHLMYENLDTNTMRCSGCGLRVTSEFLEDLANGYRKRNSGTGSPATPTPSAVQQAFAALGGALGATTLTQQSYYALQGNPLGASPRVEEPVPVTEEILAYRGWMLDQDDRGPVLKSVTRDVAWEISMRADRVPTHDDGGLMYPSGLFRPGIYAMRKLDKNYEQCPVVGEVALSGIVIEGEYGYRAERAVVRALTLRALPDPAPLYTPQGNGIYLSIAGPVKAKTLRWDDPPFRVAQLLAERYQVECELDLESRTDLPAQELTV